MSMQPEARHQVVHHSMHKARGPLAMPGPPHFGGSSNRFGGSSIQFPSPPPVRKVINGPLNSRPVPNVQDQQVLRNFPPGSRVVGSSHQLNRPMGGGRVGAPFAPPPPFGMPGLGMPGQMSISRSPNIIHSQSLNIVHAPSGPPRHSMMHPPLMPPPLMTSSPLRSGPPGFSMVGPPPPPVFNNMGMSLPLHRM